MEHRKDDPAWQLRKYLLLLAILVATVTYVRGLDPPGGVWLETGGGHLTGNPILHNTRHVRYDLFYYSNATAFTASLVIILLLLLLNQGLLNAVRGVMVLELLCLMVAYVAGSCRGILTTVYASLLSAAVFVYVVAHTLLPPRKLVEAVEAEPQEYGKLRLKERRKVLMLLAIFVTTITYTAGLDPPGGFWEHAQEGQGGRRAGDPTLQEGNSGRFVAFFVCNTTAFAASLAIIMLLLSSRMRNSPTRLHALHACIAVALLGLIGAYAAGSCRETHSTVYVLCLAGAVLVYISIIAVLDTGYKKGPLNCCPEATTTDSALPSGEADTVPVDKARSLILLLATLVATVTYQAGLVPPGGVWRDNKYGHNGGDLILLAAHEWRYKVFFYCNSAAFVASIIIIIMVQGTPLVNRHALEAALILDLFGLMGAYTAGSCRDVRTSMYVVALAVVMFVFVGVYNSSIKVPSPTNGGHGSPAARRKTPDFEKRRKFLLLLAILAVTITYQAGLTPPGGFWIEHAADEARHYGDPVLADNYPRRYKAFFYCNATSFMASVAVIILLQVNRTRSMSDTGRYFKALYACMAAGLFGLMGAYAAGSSRTVRTSIFVFVLVGVVLVFAVLHIQVIHTKLERWFPCLRKIHEPEVHGDTRNKGSQHVKYIEGYRMRKYVMLLGILAASVTYEAGLAPPGGVWSDNVEGHAVGNPILRDTDRSRYRAFFYSNSTSFMASVVIVVLLIQGILVPELGQPLRAMHSAVVLDLLGLLVAYAAGSSRDWGTSGYVLAMAATVLAYLPIYVVLSLRGVEARGAGGLEVERPTGQLDIVEVGDVELDVVEIGDLELDVVQVDGTEVPVAPPA